ncbi:MAG: hemin uptake protein HemP [Candidatus Omnitrophica bacterium]|nr:hemin uptake protein HemP [Candidatus Omnitrophota bacterium]
MMIHESKKLSKIVKPTPKPIVVSSKELFKGNREIMIEHLNQYYRLQITKAGKLILNK